MHHFGGLPVELNIENLVKILLPTLCIFCSFSRDPKGTWGGFHQTFGSSNYFLELSLSTNPNGWFQRGETFQKIRFQGVLVTPNEQKRVAGLLENRQGHKSYHFITEKNSFVGKLSRVPNRCEPSLEFEKPPKSPIKDVMHAGFCGT